MPRRYDWDGIISALSAHPNTWLLVFPDWNARVARQVRYRRNPALRRPDGYLDVVVLNKYTDLKGVRRGNVYLKWVPTEGEQQ